MVLTEHVSNDDGLKMATMVTNRILVINIRKRKLYFLGPIMRKGGMEQKDKISRKERKVWRAMIDKATKGHDTNKKFKI